MDKKTTVMIRVAPPSDRKARPMMLAEMLFSPLLKWMGDSLRAAGLERFIVICPESCRQKAAACFPPEVSLTVITGEEQLSDGEPGDFLALTRPALLMKDTMEKLESYAVSSGLSAAALMDREECRTGAYWFAGVTPAWLGARLCDPDGLDAALEMEGLSPGIYSPGQEDGTVTVQDYGRLQAVQQVMRASIVQQHIDAGVCFLSPDTAFISPETQIGAGTVVLPNVLLRGRIKIGADCRIGPDTVIDACQVGDGCSVVASHAYESVIGGGVNIGPFAYIRPGCDIGDGVKIGDFVELKKARVGSGTKIPHLSYMGDAQVGSRVNFGCGAITANYNGAQKNVTQIGDDVFVGSNVNLIAPVTIGNGAFVAAGSTINASVPDDAMAIARARQENKPGGASRYRLKTSLKAEDSRQAEK